MKSFATLATLATLIVPSAVAAPYKKRQVIPQEVQMGDLNDLDYAIVSLAWSLEDLELNLWNQALTNFTAEDFTNAGLPADFYAGLELLRDQEIAHTSLLQEVLAQNLTNCTFTFPVYTPADVISFGQIVTSVGEGAYLGALPNITSPAVRKSAGQIIGNEARQNSYLRLNERLNFFNAPDFDTPLTASQAYSLAAPYTNCPVANPALSLNFKLIPALNITVANAPANGTNVTTDLTEGTALNVAWNASEAFLGDDVFLVFLSDSNSVRANLTQSGNQTQGAAMGTTVLPPLMNGTVFAVATIYDAPGVIPDDYNYAIGSLVVA